MDKQRPLSRAYCSFYSVGKEDGGITVHLGSGAAAATAAGGSGTSLAAQGADEALHGNLVAGAGGRFGGNGEEGSGGAEDMFEGGCAWAFVGTSMKIVTMHFSKNDVGVAVDTAVVANAFLSVESRGRPAAL